MSKATIKAARNAGVAKKRDKRLAVKHDNPGRSMRVYYTPTPRGPEVVAVHHLNVGTFRGCPPAGYVWDNRAGIFITQEEHDDRERIKAERAMHLLMANKDAQ